MLSKIDIFKILKDHFDTLRDFNTGDISKKDCATFFIVPLFISSIFEYLGYFISENLAIALITAFSIIIGLLLNLLIIIFDIVNKTDRRNGGEDKTPRKDDALKLKFLKEIYSNISFTIFISIFNVIILLFTFTNIKELKSISDFLSVYIMSCFIFTLLMILKRIHILLSKEFPN